MEITFLSVADVIILHEEQIERRGGEPGVLKPNQIESAVAMAQGGVGDEYFHTFPWGMAAAYAYYLAANHGFVDGNKRTGFTAAFFFLRLNGWDLPDAAGQGLKDLLLATANGSANKDAIEQYLRQVVVPLGGAG